MPVALIGAAWWSSWSTEQVNQSTGATMLPSRGRVGVVVGACVDLSGVSSPAVFAVRVARCVLGRVIYVTLDVPCCPKRLCTSEVAMPVRAACQLAMVVNQESKFQSFKTSLPAREHQNWPASLASATKEANTRVRVRLLRTGWKRSGRGGAWHQRPVATNALPYTRPRCDATSAGAQGMQTRMA